MTSYASLKEVQFGGGECNGMLQSQLTYFHFPICNWLMYYAINLQRDAISSAWAKYILKFLHLDIFLLCFNLCTTSNSNNAMSAYLIRGGESKRREGNQKKQVVYARDSNLAPLKLRRLF